MFLPCLHRVMIDGNQLIRDHTFYKEFADKFGFPPDHCQDRDSLVKCMSSIHCCPGGMIILDIENAPLLKHRGPKQYMTILECAASINHKRLKDGGPPLLVLSFNV